MHVIYEAGDRRIDASVWFSMEIISLLRYASETGPNF